jgi:hypothetical protein
LFCSIFSATEIDADVEALWQWRANDCEPLLCSHCDENFPEKISLKFSVLILANCQLVLDRRRRLRGGRKRLHSGASLNSCLHSGSFVILYSYTQPTMENDDGNQYAE